MLFSKRPKVASTPFSDFIRNASSADKKKVYKAVLVEASEQQRAVLLAKGRKPATDKSGQKNCSDGA